MKYRLLKDHPYAKAGTVIEMKSIDGDDIFLRCYTLDHSIIIPTSVASEWLQGVGGRWKPKSDEIFWIVQENRGVRNEYWYNQPYQNRILEDYNVFQTKEQAEACADLCLEARKKYTESLNQE